MTVYQKITATNPVEERSLARLRIRESTLRQQAQQLQARAEHLQRVGRGHLERYARRVDAHEKIVLGALVKKAGLDVCRVDAVTTTEQQPNDVVLSSMGSNEGGKQAALGSTPSKQQRNDVVLSSISSKVEGKDDVSGSTPSKQQPNDVVLSSIDCRVADLSASYDRELILGGLLWLASVLSHSPGDVVAVPAHDVLRDTGRLAGANTADKTTRRARS